MVHRRLPMVNNMTSPTGQACKNSTCVERHERGAVEVARQRRAVEEYAEQAARLGRNDAAHKDPAAEPLRSNCHGPRSVPSRQRA